MSKIRKLAFWGLQEVGKIRTLRTDGKFSKLFSDRQGNCQGDIDIMARDMLPLAVHYAIRSGVDTYSGYRVNFFIFLAKKSTLVSMGHSNE
jgi:hypothetical protein